MAIRRVEKTSRLWLFAGAVAVLALGGYFAWHHFSNRESTDDAQVSGHVSPVSSRVGGIAKTIHVKDNQPVHAGDVLVELDARDYEIALAKAEADLEAAKAGARAARTSVPIASTTTASTLNVAETQTANAEAAVHAAERELDAAKARVTTARAKAAEAAAIANRAAQDLERLKPLLAKDEISKQQYDAAVAADQAARSSAAAAESAVTEAGANVEVVDARRLQAEGALKQAKANASAAATAPQQVALTEARAAGADAQVQQAQAAVDLAKLNLDRATVRAPANGVVSKKSIEPGQIVQPGQPLMALTSLDDVWVTANFKETQLREMRAGEKVDVSVDAFGGKFHGHVDSIAAATGATFSLLPPDNASGNYVKVVQRVPVKIVLDDVKSAGGQLRPGMSVSATVYLK